MKRTCIRGTAKERLDFYSKLDAKSGCKVWQGAFQTNGYGQASDNNGRGIGAHRLAYQEYVGEIPEGMYVCHRCDNRACVNPDHLFAGTGTDNMRDAKSKGRHPHGAKHGSARLSESDIAAIRKSNVTQIELAREYGVRQAHISRIKLRQSWAHL